ncbi:hypothetical protein EUX98_g7180, partial [Antrodiella citrinella]
RRRLQRLPPDSAHDTHTPVDNGNTSSSSSVPPAASPTKAVTKENGKKTKPSSSSAAAPNPTSGAKPKSTKQPARSPSPSPPPPPTRPPLQTVRLEIKLGGQDNYAVDISALAKETGQRQSTPVPVSKRDSSDDSHSEGDDEGDSKPQPKKKRKRNAAPEYYDVSDPFIDDSELTKDERTFFAETKQQGFYVSSGQVALQHNVPQAKKPKSRKVNIMAPAASVSAALATLPASLAPLSLNGASSSSSKHPPASPRRVALLKEEGSKDAPIALLSEDDQASANGLKRKASEGEALSVNGTSTGGVASTSKKKRKIEIRPFHPDLQVMIEQLKKTISEAENFDQKGKFPPTLKPVLAQVALKAIVLGEYDDNFFNLMPTLFPYNKFTMTKLIKRTIWRDHTNLLLDRQNACLQELAKVAEDGFPRAKEEYEKSLAAWEKRHEKAKQDSEAGPSAPQPPATSVESTPVPSDAHPTPNTGTSALPPREDGHESGHEEEGAVHTAGAKGGKDANPPTKKFRLTEDMKALIWQLVCLSNECCRIENEKNSLLEQNNQIVSEQGVRKSLYQKIVAAFPEGWLSSGQISRDVSVMKKKYEKDAMEE